MTVGFRIGRNTKKHRRYQTWWSGVGKWWRLGVLLLRFNNEGQDVFMKECELVLEDYMAPNVEGGKKQCFCNKHECTSYERGHDHTSKNALCAIKRNKRKIVTIEGNWEA